jgi:hypothetical protein
MSFRSPPNLDTTAAVVFGAFVYCSVVAWLATRPVARASPATSLRVE